MHNMSIYSKGILNRVDASASAGVDLSTKGLGYLMGVSALGNTIGGTIAGGITGAIYGGVSDSMGAWEGTWKGAGIGAIGFNALGAGSVLRSKVAANDLARGRKNYTGKITAQSPLADIAAHGASLRKGFWSGATEVF